LITSFFGRYHYFNSVDMFFNFARGYLFTQRCPLLFFMKFQSFYLTKFFRNELHFLFLAPIVLFFITTLILEEFSIFLNTLFLSATFLSIPSLIVFSAILTIFNLKWFFLEFPSIFSFPFPVFLWQEFLNFPPSFFQITLWSNCFLPL
jgi:hypothetical protein